MGVKKRLTQEHKLRISASLHDRAVSRLKESGFNPPPLTKEQEEVLDGLLLGDGCLYRGKDTQMPHLTTNRSFVDMEYLRWTERYFTSLMARPIYDFFTFDKRTNKQYHGARLVTRSLEVFVPWYERWYPNEKKAIPEDLVLTPTKLAIWFADDGHVRSSCSPHRLHCKLATHGFLKQDVEWLQSLLIKRYNEYFSITKENTITASDAGTRAFLQEIDSVIPPGIERKLHWRKPESSLYDNIAKKIARWGKNSIKIQEVLS